MYLKRCRVIVNIHISAGDVTRRKKSNMLFPHYSFSCEFVDVELFPPSNANITFRQLVVEWHVLEMKTCTVLLVK